MRKRAGNSNVLVGETPLDGDLQMADVEVVYERAADQRADARPDAGRQRYSGQVGGSTPQAATSSIVSSSRRC